MENKYRKSQPFGKKIEVPDEILERINSNSLNIDDYIKYDLVDKVPVSVLKEEDAKILELFGIEKLKNVDFELVNGLSHQLKMKELLLKIDPSVDSINLVMYESVKDYVPSILYSSGMKKLYPSRFFDITEEELTDSNNHDEYNINYLKVSFNRGTILLMDIIKNWSIFQDMDLSYCLKNDSNNKYNVTNENIKQFMREYGNIVDFILEEEENIYEVIYNIYGLDRSDSDKASYLSSLSENILYKRMDIENLTNEQYRTLFKYVSLETYLSRYNEYAVEKIFNELEDYPENYIYNISIPISAFMDSGVLSFVGIYGLKNILDFDELNDNIFTKDNCRVLKLVYPAYLKCAINIQNPERQLFKYSDVDKIYTKEEFYEVIRKMMIYGPTDNRYVDKAIDFRNINGEFKKINGDLFISEEAPEELKDLFYTKRITPSKLVEHPEYIQYLKEKNLASCFENVEVLITGNNNYQLRNLYQYLIEQASFESAMNIILQYADVFKLIYEENSYNLHLLSSDHFMGNLKSINDTFRRIIIEEYKSYPKNIPANLRKAYPRMFLDEKAPNELKQSFYDREITSKYIIEHPEYEEILRNIDIECLYRYVKVFINYNNKKETYSLIELIKNLYGEDKVFDMMLIYGDYINQMYDREDVIEFRKSKITKKEIEDRLNSRILQYILEGKIKYSENIPSEIRLKNPTLFLSEDAPTDIKNKFYNRAFIMSDYDNPDILKYFSNTNIICGLDLEFSWLIDLFNEEDITKSNENKKKVYDAYIRINDKQLQKTFREFVQENKDSIDFDKLDNVSEVLERLSCSNSSEIYNFRNSLALQILRSSNPLDSLNKIEDIFLKNNLPTVGKIYSVFELLYPECKNIDFSYESMVSPILKEKSVTGRETIIFSDLLKASFSSNNRSIRSYINNIERGYDLYLSIISEQKSYENLNDIDKNEINNFRNHLVTLYNNTRKGRRESNVMDISENVIDDITRLYSLFSPDGSVNYNLADRVISMFAHFAGIDTLEEAKGYLNSKMLSADHRNRLASEEDFKIELGDFIKGIGGIEYLASLLQNGVLSKEFLGSAANSDVTPLDTDLSKIVGLDKTTDLTIEKTTASEYGPIKIVLRSNKFHITRTKYSDQIQDKDVTKLEAFYIGKCNTELSDHYGVRTGFGSTEIDYIVVDDYDERIGLEIAINGFYIPVVNNFGKVLFTKEDYDDLRHKMSGLKYYGNYKYEISENLNVPGIEKYISILPQKENNNKIIKQKIETVITSALKDIGLSLKNPLDKDLSFGSAELIGTGSSQRNTDLTGYADIDYLIRLDRHIINNENELNKVRKVLAVRFGKSLKESVNIDGSLKLKDVVLDGVKLDIDISFTRKNDKISYSTEMALSDRLETIKVQEPTLYSYIISNILLAKQVLKSSLAYKPDRGVNPEGGLGGVGVENWILQYGGSFIDAAKSFVECSEGRSFEEFKEHYQIWDFGENHLASKKGIYIHDNFVRTNMNEEGYLKMKQALIEYLNKYNFSLENQSKVM